MIYTVVNITMGVRRLFSTGGQKHTIYLKNAYNILFSFKIVKKLIIFAGQEGLGGGGGAFNDVCFKKYFKPK